MNIPVNNPTPETKTRVWVPYDPESVIGEFGWLWHQMGDGFEWHLTKTIEDDETDTLLAWMVGAGDGHTSDCAWASRLAGLPYLPCLAPSISQGKADRLEVIIRLPGGASAAHAFGPGERTERIDAALKSILNFGSRNTAAIDVLAERRRQIEAEGWTPEHDDGQPLKMAAAGACYVLWSDAYPNQCEPPALWPWDAAWWKPKDYRRDLVRAAALILAEIERLDRAAAKSS